MDTLHFSPKNNITVFRLEPQDYSLFPKGRHSFFLVKNRVLKEIKKWLQNKEFYNAE